MRSASQTFHQEEGKDICQNFQPRLKIWRTIHSTENYFNLFDRSNYTHARLFDLFYLILVTADEREAEREERDARREGASTGNWRARTCLPWDNRGKP